MSTEVPGDGARLSIQAVSDLLAVPAPTIRSWERRYGLPKSSRTAGGHRRYSPADVAALRLMRDEVTSGRRPADAAALVRDTGDSQAPHRPLIEAFLHVTQTLSARELDSLLDRCRDRLGIEETISGVVLPGMREVGLAWQTGEYDTAQEHLVTQATRGWLKKILFLGPVPWHRQTIVLCCGPAELHTIGLEAMEVLLSQRGWECHMLGENTPPEALTAAIRRTAAAAAIVVSHIGKNRGAAIASIRLTDLLSIQVFYAGNAFLAPPARTGIPGTYLGEDLRVAVDIVSHSLQETERP